MRLAILGGTGRIGGHVLNWALDAGYPVTALARSPEALLQAALVQEGRARAARGHEAARPQAQGGDVPGLQTAGAVPLSTGPLGTGPLGTGPLGTGPLGTGPLGTGPLGTGPLGTGPLGPVAQNGGLLGAAARGTDALVAAALSPAAGLTVVRGDALDEAAVAEVIDGADAVISALGPRGAKAPALLAGAAANIVSAMQQTGARRLICVSAAGAYVTGDPNMGRLVKLILPRIFAKPFADVRAMEGAIRASGLDWTLVRATRLVNGPGTGHYRVSPDYSPPGGGKISRADVAHFIAATLTGNSWLRSAPALAY